MAIIVTFLPAFLLSGFLFDINSMPVVVQAVTYLVPSRYFVSLMQTLFLAGDVSQVVIINLLSLLAMLLFFTVLVSRSFHKRLE
jgi:ABC-2 type transport system permease protein